MDPRPPELGETDWRAVLLRLDRIDRRLDLLGAPESQGEDDGHVGPPPTRRRRFTLLDMMILVAFTALALPAYRSLPEAIADVADPSRAGPEQVIVSMLISWAFVTPMAVALTLATSVLRRVGPRPGPRPLSRQPGALGVTVASLALIAIVPIHLALLAGLGGAFDLEEFLFYGLIACPKVVGGVVAGVWLTLRSSGRFDPTADWVDGLGRAMCIYWLIAGTLNISLF